MNYVTGKVIKELREKKHFTQKQLAEVLGVSDKTISKWETDRGLPDIGLIGSLSEALGVSVAELLVGAYAENDNRSANMKKIKFYVCPVCGNVIQAIGEGAYSCCGILLPAAEVENENSADAESDVEANEIFLQHRLEVDEVDHEFYVHMTHPMTKAHYISFAAYVTANHTELVKLYPEQNVECRFAKHGHGDIYAFCNQHGLFRVRV